MLAGLNALCGLIDRSKRQIARTDNYHVFKFLEFIVERKIITCISYFHSVRFYEEITARASANQYVVTIRWIKIVNDGREK